MYIDGREMIGNELTEANNQYTCLKGARIVGRMELIHQDGKQTISYPKFMVLAPDVE